MNLNQPTLIQFETERKKNNFIPPEGSNSFYNIGQGRINISVIRENTENCRFDLYTDQGSIYTGIGDFIISGDIEDSSKPYRNMIIIQATSVHINSSLTISGGELEVHGNLELMENAKLYIQNGSHIIFYTDSIFSVKNNSNIIIDDKSSVEIYGRIDCHVSKVDNLVNSSGIIIDSAAVMNVDGIDDTGRPYSLTDYNADLREKVINVHTQGEKNFEKGRVGYTWKNGIPLDCSQIIRMNVLWGEAVLGDFKLSVLGMPERLISNLQIISDLIINKGTTLYITENYEESNFIRPELYIGIIINNNNKPGACIVEGNIVVDGENCMITVDRGASLHIQQTGIVYLKNKSVIRSTHNKSSDRVLMIDGTLIIDSIEQINSFSHDNILIGETGKVIILNPDKGEKVLLWTTPNGIKDTDLYRLFEDRIDHVEYHISNNTGIGIDQYFEYYNREMTNWYGGRRIEQAIHDGILVWHNGGFIELYHNITPWADENSTLLHAGRLFKSFGSFDEDKLQDAVNRLSYAGAGNILFRFINDNKFKEVILNIEGINIESALNHPLTNMYIIDTNNDGEIFIRNKVKNTTPEELINNKARSYEVIDKKVEFSLP